MGKTNYIELSLTTEDGIQHLRLHGHLKRHQYPVKTEQIFQKGSEDFGMFIIIIPSEDLYTFAKLDGDLFSEFEVLDIEDERWNAYKKLKDKDFVQNISNFMFSLTPESKIDIDTFTEKANEATLELFKNSPVFMGDYVLTDFMTFEEKIIDLDYLISYFESQERYEDCAVLIKIRKKIEANEEFIKEPK